MRVGDVGPELCTECLKRFRKASEVWSQSLFKVLPLKEKLVIVNWVLWSHKLRNYAAMNIFYAFKQQQNPPERGGHACWYRNDFEFGKNYTWIATWWSMWIGYTLNKNPPRRALRPFPTRNNIKVQSSASVFVRSGAAELGSAALRLHSLRLRVQMQTQHFPVCALPSSAPSAVQVCERRAPGLQRAHRPPFLSRFTL